MKEMKQVKGDIVKSRENKLLLWYGYTEKMGQHEW
jgi:hypothetical protein